ncbi:MAG TPA: hypothetical protein VFT56_08820 [Sphingomonas sp.]|nr:hypothetical protein [Sphingomonas sp.]
MRLIVHLGFHKTASTFLQQLLACNRDQLASRGFWYDAESVCGAHHPIANPLLAGDSTAFAAMIGRARHAGCHTILFSSENLEALPFVPEVAALVEATAAEAGVETIEWQAVLREPGAYFESLHSQFSRHSYADTGHMFSEVMKKGVLFMPEPHFFPGAAPYWFFCFDYAPFLQRFAASGRRLFVYDYTDPVPYPGWAMIDQLGICSALTIVPSDEDRNHRLSPEQVRENFRARLFEAVNDPALWTLVTEAAETSIAASFATVGHYARAVGLRYADSHGRALDEFRPKDACTGRSSVASRV